MKTGLVPAGKPIEQRTAQMQSRYPVPVAPILRLLEKWLDEKSKQKDWERRNNWELSMGEQDSSPIRILAHELEMTVDTATRMMSRYRNKETTYMAFNNADRIVSILYGPHYWYVDDELREIYETCA